MEGGEYILNKKTILIFISILAIFILTACGSDGAISDFEDSTGETEATVVPIDSNWLFDKCCEI